MSSARRNHNNINLNKKLPLTSTASFSSSGDFSASKRYNGGFTPGQENSLGSVPSTPKGRPSQGAGGRSNRVPRRAASMYIGGGGGGVECLGEYRMPNSNYCSPTAYIKQQQRQRNAVTPPFAGSKFTDSPSARAVPLPPVSWFDDESTCESTSFSLSDSCPSSSDSESSSSLCSTDVISSASSMTKTMTSSGVQAPGIRLSPFQLIAACSAVV